MLFVDNVRVFISLLGLHDHVCLPVVLPPPQVFFSSGVMPGCIVSVGLCPNDFFSGVMSAWFFFTGGAFTRQSGRSLHLHSMVPHNLWAPYIVCIVLRHDIPTSIVVMVFRMALPQLSMRNKIIITMMTPFDI